MCSDPCSKSYIVFFFFKSYLHGNTSRIACIYTCITIYITPLPSFCSLPPPHLRYFVYNHFPKYKYVSELSANSPLHPIRHSQKKRHSPGTLGKEIAQRHSLVPPLEVHPHVLDFFVVFGPFLTRLTPLQVRLLRLRFFTFLTLLTVFFFVMF